MDIHQDKRREFRNSCGWDLQLRKSGRAHEAAREALFLSTVDDCKYCGPRNLLTSDVIVLYLLEDINSSVLSFPPSRTRTKMAAGSRIPRDLFCPLCALTDRRCRLLIDVTALCVANPFFYNGLVLFSQFTSPRPRFICKKYNFESCTYMNYKNGKILNLLT